MLVPLMTHALPFAYLANFNINEVDVIDVATNSLLTRIAIPALYPAPDSNPSYIAIAPNGKTVCVANSNSISSVNAISISVIDATLAIPALLVPSIPVTGFSGTILPRDIAYTTDSNSVYITSSDDNIYSVTIDSQTVAIATSAIQIPGPIAIGNTPNGETAYVGTSGFGLYYMGIVPASSPSVIASTVDPNISIQAIAIAPNGRTAYAAALNTSSDAILYVIDTASNMVTNSSTIATNSFPTGIVISPDGNYLYITDESNNDVIVIPTNNLSNITTFTSSNALALAITPDSKELYVADGTADVSPYRVPAGTPVTPSPISLGGGNVQFSIVISPPSPSPLSPPSSVSGCKTKNVFLLQTDYINNITWTAPATGTTPAAYAIYRDPMLTQLVSIVPANGPLQYYDHDRNPNVTDSYYIVSVDASGNQSAPVSVTVTQNC
jgi:YVTN family beta-propeller protein